MTASLTQIAFEVAATNPGSTAEDISKAIVNAIESEDALNTILGLVRLPSSRDLSIARMKKRRSPKNEANRIDNKLELVEVVDRIKSGLYSGYSSGMRHTAFGEDYKVVEETIADRFLDGNARFPQRTAASATNQTEHTVVQVRDSYNHYLNLPRETRKNEPTQHIVSMDALIENLLGKNLGGQILSLDDIDKISLMVEYSNDSNELTKIIRILQADIGIRNKTLKVNCVRDLYEGDEMLPKEYRTHHPEPKNMKHQIYERIRAILFNEQRRLQRQISLIYLNGEMEYGEYTTKVKKEALYATRLYPVEP